MHSTKTMLIAAIALSITACHTLKKNTKTAAPTVQPTKEVTVNTPTTQPASYMPFVTPKSRSGIYEPGTEELTAIQAKYTDVSMQTLTEGHALYIGVCTNCHGAKSIYAIPEDSWPGIIDNMAKEARITDVQKDAVLKYVLAIKATQPK